MNKELRDRLCKGCENYFACYKNNTRCKPFRKELHRLRTGKDNHLEEMTIIDKLSDLICNNESKENIVELTVALRKLRHPNE